jgi:hypothetical protein
MPDHWSGWRWVEEARNLISSAELRTQFTGLFVTRTR